MYLVNLYLQVMILVADYYEPIIIIIITIIIIGEHLIIFDNTDDDDKVELNLEFNVVAMDLDVEVADVVVEKTPSAAHNCGRSPG